MEIEICGTGNKVQLVKMLAYIEWCGNVGHTPKYLNVYIDGDGSTRFKFKFKDENMQMYYDGWKRIIANEWNKNGKDLEFIEL